MVERATRLSTPHLFVDVVTQIAGLVRTEIQLVRAELSEKVSRTVNAAGLLAGAAILLLAALVILLQGAVTWLAIAGLELQWAELLVGAAVGIVGLGLLFTAISWLKVATLRPHRLLARVDRHTALGKEIGR
jgi:hypothetical protein